MHASDLVKVCEEFNSHEEEIFDKCADSLILLIKTELEKIYENNQWMPMVTVSKLGIAVDDINYTFSNLRLKNFKLKIENAWLFHLDDTPDDYDDLINFDELIKDKTYDELEETFDYEICGFSSKDILCLKPFCDALKRKGFTCYFNEISDNLLVVFNIK